MSSAVTTPLSQRLVNSQTSLSVDEINASIDSFSPAIIPGPLQTSAYARAVLASCGVSDVTDLERAVQVRLERGQRLRTHPQHHRYLMTAHALHAPWLGSAEHQEQQVFLRECAQLPHLQVRMLPEVSPIPWTGAFAVLTYTEGTSLVNLETPAGRLVVPQEMVAAYRTHFETLFAAARPLSRLLAPREGAGP